MDQIIGVGSKVFYTGKRFEKQIGIRSGRTGTVDAIVKETGGHCVSFARRARPDADGDGGALEASPEGFVLSGKNLRLVPQRN